MYLKVRSSRITLLVNNLKTVSGNTVSGNGIVKPPLNSVYSYVLVHWVEGGGKEEISKYVLLVCTRNF